MRSLRRHHEQRLRARYRKVADRWAGNAFVGVDRIRYVEQTASRLAHHHNCPCWMCKRPRYDRRRDGVEP